MRISLFWKIYLTIIVFLVLLLGMPMLRFGADEVADDWSERRQHFVETYFSSPLDSESLAAEVGRLADALRVDIGVFNANGRLIASVGGPFPPDIDDLKRWSHAERGYFVGGTLDDGTQLIGKFREQLLSTDRRQFRRNFGIAFAFLLGLYPVMHSLTGRLQRLGDGIKKWGNEGRFPLVAVEGKDEIAALATSFNLAAERTERRVEAHRSLLASASHRLRSPLVRLRLAVDRQAEQTSEALRAEIVHSLAEIDELIEEILLASRLDKPDA